MSVKSETDNEGKHNVLDTVEGEISFFKALMRARPLGINRYFHIMAMKIALDKELRGPVHVNDIWEKLESCYNMEALETLESEYEAQGSSGSTPQPLPSPSPGENLTTHPFFHSEFSLPTDPYIDQLIASRRLRESASVSPSPEPSPTRSRSGRAKRRKVTGAVKGTGLVSGDSDSSALTQESGDEVEEEGAGQTPSERRGSTAPGTDAGTEELPDEDTERTTEASPDPQAVAKPRRGGRKSASGNRGRGTIRGRARGKR